MHNTVQGRCLGIFAVSKSAKHLKIGAVIHSVSSYAMFNIYSRKALSASYVHPPLVAGIYGRKADGARSVVLAGEYDDEDHGDSLYARLTLVYLKFRGLSHS